MKTSNSMDSRIALSAMKLVTFGVALVAASGCTRLWSETKSAGLEPSEIESETLYIADKEKVSVQLTASDSALLKKALVQGALEVSEKDDEPGSQTLLESLDKDLRIECGTEATPVTQSNCFVIFNVKPLDGRNSVQYGELANEYTFQLFNPDAARAIYSGLNVKELDLQGSTYKRFASFDNRMIFECILDAERSRCSIFLSEDGGLDESD